MLLGVQLAGGALAAVGIALLSRSSIVATETKTLPGEVGQEPARPGPGRPD